MFQMIKLCLKVLKIKIVKFGEKRSNSFKVGENGQIL